MDASSLYEKLPHGFDINHSRCGKSGSKAYCSLVQSRSCAILERAMYNHNARFDEALSCSSLRHGTADEKIHQLQYVVACSNHLRHKLYYVLRSCQEETGIIIANRVTRADPRCEVNKSGRVSLSY